MDINDHIKYTLHSQNPLLRHEEFINYYKERGIKITPKNLEYLNKKGLLIPVIRLTRNGTLHPFQSFKEEYLTALYKKGDLIIPTKDNYEPWNRDYLFYSLYQILPLRYIQKWQELYSTGNWYDSDDEDLKEIIITRKQDRLSTIGSQSFSEKVNRYEKLLRLLLYIQNKYSPYATRNVDTIPVRGDSTGTDQEWEKFCEEFNPNVILKKSGCDETFIKSEYEGIVHEVKDLDPLINWYRFLRDFDREQKKKLKGFALLAQDYYCVLNMLRLFYKDLKGETLPEVDDDGWSRWKENLYDSLFHSEYEKIEAKRRDLHGYNSIKKIRNLDPTSFEKLVLKLFYLKGYKACLTPKSDDFGVDGYLYKDGEIIMLQCKKYQAKYKIGRPHLQQFYGTLTGLKYIYSVSKGIFVTTSDFTKPAWDYKINKPIELYNGASLVREINELLNNRV